MYRLTNLVFLCLLFLTGDCLVLKQCHYLVSIEDSRCITPALPVFLHTRERRRRGSNKVPEATSTCGLKL